MKIIEKALAFLDKDKKAQVKKQDKLNWIIEQLEKAKLQIRNQCEHESRKKRRAKLRKEYRVLSKLLKKSKKQLDAIELAAS